MEPSKLQFLASQFADKISTFVDNNERILDNRGYIYGKDSTKSFQKDRWQQQGTAFQLPVWLLICCLYVYRSPTETNAISTTVSSTKIIFDSYKYQHEYVRIISTMLCCVCFARTWSFGSMSLLRSQFGFLGARFNKLCISQKISKHTKLTWETKKLGQNHVKSYNEIFL